MQRTGRDSACAALAVFGYGLGRTTVLMLTDLDDACRIAGTTLVGGAPERGEGLVPLHDTRCGAELVPGFVNPAAGGLAVTAAVLATVTVRARRRADPWYGR